MSFEPVRAQRESSDPVWSTDKSCQSRWVFLDRMPPQSGLEYFHVPGEHRSTLLARPPRQGETIPGPPNETMPDPAPPLKTTLANLAQERRIRADRAAAAQLQNGSIFLACPLPPSPSPRRP